MRTRRLRLTDVYGLRGRTVPRGVAGPESVGAQVAIFSSSSGKQAAAATVAGDLSFRTTAALPPRRSATRTPLASKRVWAGSDP